MLRHQGSLANFFIFRKYSDSAVGVRDVRNNPGLSRIPSLKPQSRDTGGPAFFEYS